MYITQISDRGGLTMREKSIPPNTQALVQEIEHILQRNPEERYLRLLLAYALSLEKEMHK